MEDLIAFLFFIIVGIFSVLGKVKKKQKEKQRANARGRGGLTGWLHAWLIDLQKRIETQSKKRPKGSFDWEQITGESQQEQTPTIPFDDASELMGLDVAGEIVSPLPKAQALAPSPRLRMPEKPQGQAVDTPQMPQIVRRKPMPSMLLMNRSRLRQAVVWSEILGPPIALRDPFRESR